MIYIKIRIKSNWPPDSLNSSHFSGIGFIARAALIGTNQEKLGLLIAMRTVVIHAVILLKHISRLRIGKKQTIFIPTLPSHRISPIYGCVNIAPK